MKIFPTRAPHLPDDVRAALALVRKEQAITWARTGDGTYVVATTFRIVAVTATGDVRTDRPWHLVDSGAWDADTWTLTVSWVDGKRAAQWTFPQTESRLPEAFRERVQATVLISEPLGLAGPRRSGRVVLRRDLAERRVFVQAVLGRGTPREDPEVRAAVQQTGAYLAEQAGLAFDAADS